MIDSKVAIAKNKSTGMFQLIMGIFLLIIFGLSAIGTIIESPLDFPFLLFCLAMDALGVWLIELSKRKKKLRDEFAKYVAVISTGSRYIPEIASAVGKPEGIVKNNLQLMIENKFFTSAFIDRNTNYIVIGNSQTAKTPQPNNTNPNIATNQQPEMVTIKCGGCGGMNAIEKGSVGECEYCGSPIKGE